MSNAGRIIHRELRALRQQVQVLERTRAIIRWRNAALADGWLVVPKFPDVPWTEACVLHREDFQALCVTRNTPHDTLTIWAPDGLQVPTPARYGWNAVLTGVAICMFCGARPIRPQRLGEGGRACSRCAR